MKLSVPIHHICCSGYKEANEEEHLNLLDDEKLHRYSTYPFIQLLTNGLVYKNICQKH